MDKDEGGTRNQQGEPSNTRASNTRTVVTSTIRFNLVAYPWRTKSTIQLEVPVRASRNPERLAIELHNLLPSAIAEWPWWRNQLRPQDRIIALVKPRLTNDHSKCVSPLDSDDYSPPVFDIRASIRQHGDILALWLKDIAQPIPIDDKLSSDSRIIVVCFDMVKQDVLVAVSWFAVNRKQLQAGQSIASGDGTISLVFHQTRSSNSRGGVGLGFVWEPVLMMFNAPPSFNHHFEIHGDAAKSFDAIDMSKAQHRDPIGNRDGDETTVQVSNSNNSCNEDPHFFLLKAVAQTLLDGFLGITEDHSREFEQMTKFGSKEGAQEPKRSATSVLDSWQVKLDPDAFVARNFEEALLRAPIALTQLIQTKGGTLPPAGDINVSTIFQALIAFSVYIYPYQYWTNHELRTLSLRLFPSSLQRAVTELSSNDAAALAKSIAVSSWLSLTLHIYLNQAILPIIKASLSHLSGLMKDATENQRSARLFLRYLDAKDSHMRNFGHIFRDLFANIPLTKSSLFTVYILGQELVTETTSVTVTDNSGGETQEVLARAPQSRFMLEELSTLSSILPGVVLDLPSANTAKGKAAASARNKNAGGLRMVPRAVKESNRDIDVMDIEDLVTEQAPACIRSLIRRCEDITMPLGYEDRQVLHNALIMALSRLVEPQISPTGFMSAVGTQSSFSRNNVDTLEQQQQMRSVTDLADREDIIKLTLEWYQTTSGMRWSYIRDAVKMGEHDFGPHIKQLNKSFLDTGKIYSRNCTCTTRKYYGEASASWTAPTSATLYTPAYHCPHLPSLANTQRTGYTPAEMEQAVGKCRKELGLASSPTLTLATQRMQPRSPLSTPQANTTYMPHPPQLWANRCRSVAQRQRRIRLDSIRSKNGSTPTNGPAATTDATAPAPVHDPLLTTITKQPHVNIESEDIDETTESMGIAKE